MTDNGSSSGRRRVVLAPGDGREYPMGRISAVFKADGDETHDFENRGSARAGMLNVSVPGTFDQHMPGIAGWFADHPPGDTRT